MKRISGWLGSLFSRERQLDELLARAERDYWRSGLARETERELLDIPDALDDARFVEAALRRLTMLTQPDRARFVDRCIADVPAESLGRVRATAAMLGDQWAARSDLANLSVALSSDDVAQMLRAALTERRLWPAVILMALDPARS